MYCIIHLCGYSVVCLLFGLGLHMRASSVRFNILLFCYSKVMAIFLHYLESVSLAFSKNNWLGGG